MKSANELGVALRELRGKRTIRQVAKDLDISYSAVCMYETGKRRPCDNIKVKIADYYNTSVQDLFF